jgi:hypothetical protein
MGEEGFRHWVRTTLQGHIVGIWIYFSCPIAAVFLFLNYQENTQQPHSTLDSLCDFRTAKSPVPRRILLAARICTQNLVGNAHRLITVKLQYLERIHILATLHKTRATAEQ